MNWVKSFYSRQAELMGDCYYHNVEEYNKLKVSILKDLGTKLSSVLDIGAGGGQNAIAMAEISKEVRAVELLDEFVTFGKNAIEQYNRSNCTIEQGDFYTFKPNKKFSIVTYWDGFGIGDDSDQKRLLKNVSEWLDENGRAVIEVYTPWYAGYSEGKEMSFGKSKRRYGFDHENCRWLDTWWEENDEENCVKQSLRCYSPADFKMLLDGTELQLESIKPCLNWKNFEKPYSGKLETSVSYVAILKKT